MNPQDAIDFSREAIKTCMMVGGPILAASLLIGLIVGVIQAMTQVQDQTVSFVPKILLLLLMIGICLPWLTERMIDFSTESFSTPMTHWENSGGIGGGISNVNADNDSALPSQPEFQFRQSNPDHQTESKLPFNTASTQPPTPGTSIVAPALKASFTPLDPTKPATIGVPSNPTQSLDTIEPRRSSPFILPHYRISKAPKTDIEG